MGTLCLVCTKIPDSQKENRYSVETVLLVQTFKHNVRLLSRRVVRMPAINQFCKLDFQRIAVSSAMLTLHSTLYKQTCTKGILHYYGREKLEIYGICLLTGNKCSNLAIFIQ